MTKRLFYIIIIIALSLMITGCSRKVTVTFNSNGGSAVSNYETTSNKAIPLPTPVKTGYIFGGWFTGTDASAKEFTSLDIVKGDITLIAKWYSIEELVAVLKYDVLTNEVVITGHNGTPNKIYIPETIENKKVTKIKDSAFENLESITSVTIKSDMTEIGKYAFGGCYNLVNIELPDTISVIKDGAFYNCTKLTKITLPAYLTTIESGLFSGCATLLSIDIPYGVTTIKDSAFSGCLKLTIVTIPETVDAIGVDAFADCKEISRIYTSEANYDHLHNIMAVNNRAMLGKITKKA